MVKGKRRRRRTKKYGIVSILTAIVPIAVSLSSLYSFIIEQLSPNTNDKEALEERIRYSIKTLDGCDNLPMVEKNSINSTLATALQTLKIKDDYPHAKSLYDSVSDNLVRCPVVVTAATANLFSKISLVSIIVLLAVTSGIFALLWYRSGRPHTYPWTGISGADITPEIAKYLGLKEAKGVLVIDIAKDSPADKVGIQGGDTPVNNSSSFTAGQQLRLGGDIIMKIDDKEIKKIDDLLSYIESEKKVGELVTLTILRDGRTINTDLELAAKQA